MTKKVVRKGSKQGKCWSPYIFSHLPTSSHIFLHLFLLPACPLFVVYFSVEGGTQAILKRRYEIQTFSTKLGSITENIRKLQFLRGSHNFSAQSEVRYQKLQEKHDLQVPRRNPFVRNAVPAFLKMHFFCPNIFFCTKWGSIIKNAGKIATPKVKSLCFAGNQVRVPKLELIAKPFDTKWGSVAKIVVKLGCCK